MPRRQENLLIQRYRHYNKNKPAVRKFLDANKTNPLPQQQGQTMQQKQGASSNDEIDFDLAHAFVSPMSYLR